MMISSSKTGFSLIQVMVGVVIVGFLSVVLSKVLTNSFKSSAQVSQSSTLNDTANLVRLSLSNTDNCRCNFKNVVIPAASIATTSASLTSLKVFTNPDANCAGTTSPLLDVNQSIDGLTFSSFKLSGIKQFSSTKAIGTFELSAKRSADGRQVTKQISIGLDLQAQGANYTISSCFMPGQLLTNLQCSEALSPSGGTAAKSGEAWVVNGFDSFGMPTCIKVQKVIPMCGCCVGAVSGQMPSSITTAKNLSKTYYSQNCTWWRNSNYFGIVGPRSIGIKGTSCTDDGGDGGTFSGVYIANCDDGSGFNTTTNTYTP